MSHKIDLSHLFPERAQALRAQQERGPTFAYCPQGHGLPHRHEQGRCSPVACVHGSTKCGGEDKFDEGRPARHVNDPLRQLSKEIDLLPVGMEHRVHMAEVDNVMDAEYVTARSAEALNQLRAKAIADAREAMHPHPELPPPPDLAKLGAREYVRQRLEDISPWLLEAHIHAARFGSEAQKTAAKSELFDRAGTAPRNPTATPDMRGPVMILNIGGATPYDAQRSMSNGAVHVEAVAPVQHQLNIPRGVVEAVIAEAGEPAPAAPARVAEAVEVRDAAPWGEQPDPSP